jgi:FkbM family methyltransferase
MEELGLSLKYRIHLRLHNAASRFGIDGLKPVKVYREKPAFVVETTGRKIHIASALVWRVYRRGWQNRLERISREFGLGDPFVVGPRDTVLDVGANVGDFSLAAAAMGAEVHSFDGDPKVVACLERNIVGVPAIQAHRAILWKEPGEVTFYSAPDRSDSSLFRPPGEAVTSFTAEATTLDVLAQELGLGEIALLKMDAEGAEPEVLEGGRELLRRTRNVAIDTGAERLGETTNEACEALLESMGFTLLDPSQRRRKITMATRDSRP